MIRSTLAIVVGALDVRQELHPRPYRPRPGEKARSRVDANVAAVSGSFDGGEKANPPRTVKVYVRPSADSSGIAAATSGSSIQPSGAGVSR